MRTFITCFVVLLASCTVTLSQWKRCYGPKGGEVQHIAANGSTVFAFLDESGIFDKDKQAGLYRSTDNGENWERTNAVESDDYIRSIETINQTVLISTYNRFICSSDNGNTWMQANGLDKITITSITSAGSLLFAGTDDIQGVYYSSDNGLNWMPAGLGFDSNSLGVYDVEVCGTVLFAGGKSGLYRSTNYGKNWAKITFRNEEINVRSIKSKDDKVLLCTEGGNLYRSKDYGTTWVIVNSNDSLLYLSNIIVSGESFYDVTKLYGGCCTGITSLRILRSTDEGDSWNEVEHESSLKSPLSFAAGDECIFVGTRYNGIFRSSDNGENWSKVNVGLQTIRLNTFSVFGLNLFSKHYGTNYYTYVSQDYGESWERFTKQYTFIKPYDITQNNIVYEEDFRTFNFNVIPINKKVSGSFISSIYSRAIGYTGETHVAATNCGVYYSCNEGTTWSEQNETVGCRFISCMAINGTSIYIGTGDDEIFYSTNSGRNWEIAFYGAEKKIINCITALGENVIAGTTTGLMVSTNSGKNWTNIQLEFEKDVNVTALAVCNDIVLAGTSNNGILYSLNQGKNWQEMNAGLPQKVNKIERLTVHNWKVFAEIEDEGVWKLSVNTLGVAEHHEDVSIVGNISCYPNPTTNILTIEHTQFSATDAATDAAPIHYTLSTITGRVVKEFNTTEPTISVSLYGLASGVYCLTAWQGTSKTAAMITVSE